MVIRADEAAALPAEDQGAAVGAAAAAGRAGKPVEGPERARGGLKAPPGSPGPTSSRGGNPPLPPSPVSTGSPRSSCCSARALTRPTWPP
uniref:Uncharacterized protein n=1 Tax=Sphaerodactylus townsendi TaxID=933632 RepID=A0ACB8EC68_9SAUR